MADVKVDTRHLDSDQADALREDLATVYEEAYEEKLDGAFRSRHGFLDRLHGYLQRPGFDLVAASADGEDLAGYIFGFPLAVQGGWWSGFLGAVPQDVAEATAAGRVFAISELMVRPAFRRRHIARVLHDELLTHRPEVFGTILVDPANTPAKTAYLSWGWQQIGEIKPFENSPTFLSLLKRLDG